MLAIQKGLKRGFHVYQLQNSKGLFAVQKKEGHRKSVQEKQQSHPWQSKSCSSFAKAKPSLNF